MWCERVRKGKAERVDKGAREKDGRRADGEWTDESGQRKGQSVSECTDAGRTKGEERKVNKGERGGEEKKYAPGGAYFILGALCEIKRYKF